MIERIKDLIYFFISEKRKKLIKNNQKKLLNSQNIADYQLSSQKETIKLTAWGIFYAEAQKAIQTLEKYLGKIETEKILKEFSQLGNLIIKYGKISLKVFFDSRNYNPVKDDEEKDFFNKCYAIALYEKLTGLDQSFDDFYFKHQLNSYKIDDKNHSQVLYKITENLHFSNLFEQLKSLLFIMTFKEKNSRPCLVKIIENSN